MLSRSHVNRLTLALMTGVARALDPDTNESAREPQKLRDTFAPDQLDVVSARLLTMAGYRHRKRELHVHASI